ncbi:hypothetical protein [Tepidimicrobium xylanilyticum]|uniref:hypothetical protein n=1 Tax=Tepidimicrobium xylanilyticum TaxID=1123352 RepID=UPI00295EBF50|nr:hypothetical protein [Tepidimicrobium xylanilyticum]
MEGDELLAEVIKAIDKLKDYNTNNIIFEDLSLFSLKDLQFIEKNTRLKVINGFKVLILFLPAVLKRMYEGLEEDLKQMEVLIIGDEENLTKEIIESLYKIVGFITIAGDYDNVIDDMYSYILEKTGLSIFYSKKINKILTNYPIIINLKDNYDLNVDKLRKSVIIFDFSIEKGIKKQLVSKNSIFCIDNFMFKADHLNIMGNRFINSPIPSHVYEQFNFNSLNFQEFVGLSIGDKIYSIDSFIDYGIRQRRKF